MRSPPGGLRRHLPLVVILVVAASLRVAYLPVDTYPYDQSGGQAELAHNILDHGRWFEENTAEATLFSAVFTQRRHRVDPADMKFAAVDAQAHWQPFVREVIGPGMMLTAVWALTGSERYVYGGILQILVDLGVLLLLYRIVMLLFARRRAALLAAALYAVCLPVARRTSITDADIWGMYFTVAIIALYLEAMRSPGRLRWLVLCGLTVGVGAYFRPNVLLLVPALGLASLRWAAMARPLRGALVVTAIAGLMLVPWTIRNYDVTHHFIPIRVGSGVNLWQGLGEIHNDFGAREGDLETYLQVHRVRPDLGYDSVAYDAYLRRRALHVIEQHPLFYAKVVAHRILLSTVALYESAWMHRAGESPVRYRARTGKGLLSYAVNRPLELLESAYEPALFLLAMLVLVCTWRGYRRQHILLIAAILSAMIPYWLLHTEARYALPTLPLYIGWIALGADLLGERAVRRLRARRELSEAVA